MTTVTRKSGKMIGLLVLSGVFSLPLCLVAYYAFGLKHGVSDALRMTFPFIWWPLFACILGMWLYNRWHRGRILLDCGPLPHRWPIILALVACTSVAMLEIFFPVRGRVQPYGTLTHLSMCAMFAILLSIWRVQITAGGIQCQMRLLRWNDITGHHWTNDGKLDIDTKGRFSFAGPFAIPPRHRQAVDELLARYSPSTHAA